MLKAITVQNAISLLSENLFKMAEQESFLCEYPVFYLKDGDGGFHTVDSFNLMRDRVTCEDGYFDYFKYVIEHEGTNDRLFVEEK